MKRDSGIAADPSTRKQKKPIYKKWWFWVIIVFIGLGAYGSTLEPTTPPAQDPSASVASPSVEPSAEPTKEPDPTPDPAVSEEIKAAAKQADLDITSICTSAETDYNKFLEMISAGTASDLDLYNTAKTLHENLQYYNHTQLSAVKADGIKDYKDSASLYIYVMSKIADDTMKYIDDPSTSKLSDLQSSMENISSYMLDVVSEKFTFLSDAGFTADEISEMTSGGEPNAE